jgi:hypothetical protein
MLKAWSAGLGILVVAYAAWFAFLQVGKFSESSALFLWISPLIAAFVSSYLGPSRKIILGISMAFPSAILAVVVNSFYQLHDQAVDFPGFRAGLILFTLVLIYSALISVVGAVIGYFLATKRDRNNRQT